MRGASSGGPLTLKSVLRWLDPFLSIDSVLKLRQVNRAAWRRKYRIADATLRFTEFVEVDGNTVCEHVLPLVCRSVHASVREGICLDFSHCMNFKDVHLAMLCDLSSSGVLGNVKGLDFSFCPLVTDKGLEALLTSYFPHLECLSIRCGRSSALRGEPLEKHFDRKRWPMFKEFCCSFTNMKIRPIEAMAANLYKQEQCLGVQARLSFEGTPGAKAVFQRSNLAFLPGAFQEALDANDLAHVARASKLSAKLLESEYDNLERPDPLLHLCKMSGASLLVNMPVMTRLESGIDAWTLPLSIAVDRQSEQMIKLLLKRGAELDVWDYFGEGPFHNACRMGGMGVISVLIRYMPIHAANQHGESPITIAINQQDQILLHRLVAYGFNVNGSCYPGKRKTKSPLHVALECENHDAFKYLLQQGADPFRSSSTHLSPAVQAVKLDPGWLSTLLHHVPACISENHKKEVLGQLISYYVGRGDLGYVEALLKVCPYLVNARHSVWSTPIIQASRLGNCEMLEVLLSSPMGRHKSYIDASDETGQNALHVAAANGNHSCIDLLIDRGADVSKPNGEGQSALHIACWEDLDVVAFTLLRRGADIDQRELNSGYTPIVCCILSRHDRLAIQLLTNINKVPRCDLVDRDGFSILEHAVSCGRYNLADLLMDIGAEAGPHAYRSIDWEQAFDLVHSSQYNTRVLRRFKEGSKRSAETAGGKRIPSERATLRTAIVEIVKAPLALLKKR